MYQPVNAYRLPDFTNCDPNELFVCPYDKCHMIRAKRFPYHLKTCRKNHPLSDKVNCPFNARHVIARPEYQFHVTVCVDKRVIEPDIAYALQKQNGDDSYFKGCTDVPEYDNWKQPSSSENWEEDITDDITNGYNPRDMPYQPGYKSTCGMTPAEKRTHRERLFKQNERRQAGLPLELSSDEEVPAAMPKLVSAASQGSLRLPREFPKVLRQVQQNQTVLPGGNNTQLSLHGLGRGMLMNKHVVKDKQGTLSIEEPETSPETTSTVTTFPAPPGFGRGMAANIFGADQSTSSNTPPVLSDSDCYKRMLGRGRGGGPTLNNRNRHKVGGLQKASTSMPVNIPQPAPNDVPELISSPAGSTDSCSQEESEEVIRKKLIRKLNKKLNGIKLLEEKKEKGKSLTEEEDKKIQKKIGIVNEITSVQIQCGV